MQSDFQWIVLMFLAILLNEVLVRLILGKTTFVLTRDGLTKAEVKIVEMTPDKMAVATATHFVFVSMLTFLWGGFAFILGVSNEVFTWFVIPIAGLFISFAFLANRAQTVHS